MPKTQITLESTMAQIKTMFDAWLAGDVDKEARLKNGLFEMMQDWQASKPKERKHDSNNR